MTRQRFQHQQTSANDAADKSLNNLKRRTLSNEQIDCLARLIADDPNEFPSDFPPEELQALKTATKKELKSRMIAFVAKAIAIDIRHIEGSENERNRSND
jgi:hypothetical protein